MLSTFFFILLSLNRSSLDRSADAWPFLANATKGFTCPSSKEWIGSSTNLAAPNKEIRWNLRTVRYQPQRRPDLAVCRSNPCSNARSCSHPAFLQVRRSEMVSSIGSPNCSYNGCFMCSPALGSASLASHRSLRTASPSLELHSHDSNRAGQASRRRRYPGKTSFGNVVPVATLVTTVLADDRVSSCGANTSCRRSALCWPYQRLPASTQAVQPQLQQSWLCSAMPY